MNNTDCITYGKIFKRYKCLNNMKPGNYNYNPSRILENIESQCNRRLNKDIICRSIDEAINKISNYTYAINEVGMGYITSLINISNSINNNSPIFINKVCNGVIPNLMKDRLEEAKIDIEESNLYDFQKEQLLSSIKEISIIDRILNNHETISKRFNMDRITESRDISTICESVCTMIDTYDVPIYQKLNLSLEEMTYLLGRSGIDYDKSDLVCECTKYYLLSTSELSQKDINNIRSTLQESYCITNDDTNKVSFIFEDSNELSSIKDYTNSYLLATSKSSESLINIYYNAITSARDDDFRYNLNKLLSFFYDAYLADNYNDIKSEEDVKKEFDAISRMTRNEITKRANQEFIITIKNHLELLYNDISSKYNHTLDNKRRIVTEAFLEAIKEIIEEAQYILSTNYSESNISNYNYITRENASHISLQEGIFKTPVFVKTIMGLNDKCKDKSKQFAKKVSGKLEDLGNDIKNLLKFESAAIVAPLLTEDNRLDITINRLQLEDYKDIESIHKFYTGICEDYNRVLREYNKIDARAYYIINPNRVELHVGESSIIDIDISDDNIIFNDLSDPALLKDVENLNEVAAYCDYITENIDELYNLNSYISNKVNESNTPIPIDEYEVLVEALSIMNTPKETIDLLTEKYLDSLQTYVLESGYSSTKFIYNSSKIKSIDENYSPYKLATIEEYALCTGIVSSILEKKDESLLDKDRKLGEEVKKKNPLKGINFNGIKLVLQGIKNKFRSLTTKEKELSTKLDNNFKNFVSSIKKASVDKKREQIIKGDVVPSLSKCIKTGILLAGVGIFGNPILAAALAIGSFATNRKISAKEKTLICDEIETELQVIDREIANAEARNQTKRYRALLTQKKALQREYQRIKYNKNIGKTQYVSPNAGTQVES